MRKALVYGGIFFLFALGVVGEAEGQTKKKAGPSVTELQAQIIQLQTDLAACKVASAEAMKTAGLVAVEETRRLKLAPIMDAIGALRAAHSVADGGSIMDFKQYYLAAKVKVEALPPSAEASLLAPVVDAYSDANTVLLAGKGSGVATFAPSEWRRLVSTYPGIHIGTVEVDWSNATIVKDLHEGGINLINEGFKRLKVAEERLAKPSSP